MTIMIKIIRRIAAATPNITARFCVYAEPTEDTFLQWGHLASVLFRLLNCKRRVRKQKRYSSSQIVMNTFPFPHQKSVAAVTADHPAHSRNGGHRRRHGTGRKINDPLAGGPGTRDSL